MDFTAYRKRINAACSLRYSILERSTAHAELRGEFADELAQIDVLREQINAIADGVFERVKESYLAHA